jgi:hypothetical protein
MQAPQMRTFVFEGEVKADPFSAEESAAEVAIRHLSEEYNFDIGDWNYPAYVETRERLLAEQRHGRKLDAALEAIQEKAAREKQQLGELVQGVKDVCLEFADVLPVRAVGPGGVEYAGPPSPPAGGYDKLALELVQLLQSADAE